VHNLKAERGTHEIYILQLYFDFYSNMDVVDAMNELLDGVNTSRKGNVFAQFLSGGGIGNSQRMEFLLKYVRNLQFSNRRTIEILKNLRCIQCSQIYMPWLRAIQLKRSMGKLLKEATSIPNFAQFILQKAFFMDKEQFDATWAKMMGQVQECYYVCQNMVEECRTQGGHYARIEFTYACDDLLQETFEVPTILEEFGPLSCLRTCEQTDVLMFMEEFETETMKPIRNILLHPFLDSYVPDFERYTPEDKTGLLFQLTRLVQMTGPIRLSIPFDKELEEGTQHTDIVSVKPKHRTPPSDNAKHEGLSYGILARLVPTFNSTNRDWNGRILENASVERMVKAKAANSVSKAKFMATQILEGQLKLLRIFQRTTVNQRNETTEDTTETGVFSAVSLSVLGHLSEARAKSVLAECYTVILDIYLETFKQYFLLRRDLSSDTRKYLREHGIPKTLQEAGKVEYAGLNLKSVATALPSIRYPRSFYDGIYVRDKGKTIWKLSISDNSPLS
jgi:hypothetical protein